MEKKTVKLPDPAEEGEDAPTRARRRTLLSYMFLCACVLLVFLYIHARRSFRESGPLTLALRHAWEAVVGGGMGSRRLSGAAVDGILGGAGAAGRAGAPGAFGGPAGGKGAGPGSGSGPGEDCAAGDCPQTDGEAGAGGRLKRVDGPGERKSSESSSASLGTGGAGSEEDPEKEKLRLVRVKETPASEAWHEPDVNAVMKVFSDFASRFQRGGGGGAGSGPGSGTQYGDSSGGGEEQAEFALPPATEADAKLSLSPTYQTLRRAIGDTGTSLNMSKSPAYHDGAKDRTGREFDGNTKTYSPVPIEKYKGSFGGTGIRSRSKPPPAQAPQGQQQ